MPGALGEGVGSGATEEQAEDAEEGGIMSEEVRYDALKSGTVGPNGVGLDIEKSVDVGSREIFLGSRDMEVPFYADVFSVRSRNS